MINANRIKLQNEQELDYEKLVSSTKLHGATEGTARVEVFHNCQQKHFRRKLQMVLIKHTRIVWITVPVRLESYLE